MLASRWPCLLIAIAACDGREASGPSFTGSIDAYEAYMRKSKASEGAITLRHLVRGIERHWMERMALPDAPAGPTPPVGACCGLPGDRCAAASQAPEGTWAELDLTFDASFRFSYWYEVVEPQRVVVLHAIADLDCDGITSDLAARITVNAGRELDIQLRESRPDE